MRNPEVLSGLFLTLLSIGTCAIAYRLGLGSGNNPGPGFAAFGIALILGLLSLSLFLKNLFEILKTSKKTAIYNEFLGKKLILTLCLLLGYGIFLNLLGFSLSTFLLMITLIWGVGRQRFHWALAVSILTVASAYLLFVIALGLPLPVGSVWYFLGE